MPHAYRTLQHWNHWLIKQPLGHCLLEAEQKSLSQILNQHRGHHAVLVGVPHQQNLLMSTKIPSRSLISPLVNTERNHFNDIESDFLNLPLLTGSIDLLVLPHTLELVDNPHQLLAEACRVIKPEGCIAICGFNPYSAWGVRKIFTKHKYAPWSGNFIHTHKIKQWLQLADFEMEKQAATLFRPPMRHPIFYQKLHFLETIGQWIPLLGGVYVLLARAKVIPLTPIRLKWKQQLSGIRISTTISGHIARNAK